MICRLLLSPSVFLLEEARLGLQAGAASPAGGSGRPLAVALGLNSGASNAGSARAEIRRRLERQPRRRQRPISELIRPLRQRPPERPVRFR